MNHADLIDLCQRVYQVPDIVAGPDGRDGASIYRFTDDVHVLAFRGTLTSGLVAVADWLNDFHADLVREPGLPGLVHAGFLGSLRDLWPAVEKALSGVTRLIITGHSKGGALAQLAGVWLADLHPEVVTFAAPRVGDAAFANEYPSVRPLVRYEGEQDLVPLLPPDWCGYYGAGQLRCSSELSVKRRELLVGRLVLGRSWKTLVANHSLETGYRPWVKSWTPPTPAQGAA